MANTYSGNNTGKALPVTKGRFEQSVAAAAPILSVVVTEAAVRTDNTIVYTLETDSADLVINPQPNYISARADGVSFTVTLDAINNGASANSIFVNYAIF